MPSAVVDASTLVDLLTGGPATGVIFDRLFRPRTVLHAPHSIDVEVAHAIRKIWRRGLIVDADVEEISSIYAGIEIERHALGPVLHRVWRMRYNITSYDAAYVALAEWLDLPLLTRDRALSRASGHAARIEYID